jgi:hypothetical protein
MSDIQLWLMAMASSVLSQPWYLVIVPAALIGCAVLALVVVGLRGHRVRSRASRAPTKVPVPPTAADGVPDRIAVPDSPAVVRAVSSGAPSHSSTTGPLRSSRERRHTSDVVPGAAVTHGATGVLTPLAGQPEAVTHAEQLRAEQTGGAPTVTALTTAVADSPTAEALAEQEYRQGLRLLARQSTDRATALRAALACFRRAQEYWTRDQVPERWATIQNDIGRVYQELPSGDRAHHLQTAIMHHESALEVFDPAAHPMHWAWTQAALGAAYLNNPRGSALANARAAVAYYQRALDVFTPETAPLAWAWNQNNLGAALETVRGGAEGERVVCLRDAATCYELALRVFTSEAYATQHTLVSRNLERVRGELRALE